MHEDREGTAEERRIVLDHRVEDLLVLVREGEEEALARGQVCFPGRGRRERFPRGVNFANVLRDDHLVTRRSAVLDVEREGKNIPATRSGAAYKRPR